MKRTTIITLLLVVSILTASFSGTVAWFTDSVSTARNTIQSGNLDAILEYKTELDGEWQIVEEDTLLFKEDALYEPGYVETVFLRVKNAGSLAFKYNLSLDVEDTVVGDSVLGNKISLSNYLDMGVYRQDEYFSGANYWDLLSPTMFGSRQAALSSITDTVKLSSKDEEGKVLLVEDVPVRVGEQTSQIVALVLQMPTTVGNEANHKTGTPAPKIQLGLNLLATQLVYEEDSFGADYDKDAEYPDLSAIQVPEDAIAVSTFEEFKTAITKGGNYEITGSFTVEGILNVEADTALYNVNPNNVVAFAQNARLKTAENADLALYGVQIDGGGSFTMKDGEFVYADGKNKNSDAILMAFAGSTLTLGQGTVIENVVSMYPAVAWAEGTVDNRAKIILDGATIQNCAGGSGSIINVDRYGDVYIEENTVIANNVSHSGNHGIIRIYNENWDADNASTLTMNGGEIKNNYFSGNGMIGLYYAKMNMNGGKISANSWSKVNSGFYCITYVHSHSQFIMNGGEISGNSITEGAINAINSEVEGAITFNGGTVTNNINARNENKDALAAVCYPNAVATATGTEKVLVISDQANVTGTIYSHANLQDQVDKKYIEISEYLGK